MDLDLDLDLFTPEFKRLKARRPPPDFSDVIDVGLYDQHKTVHNITKVQLEATSVRPVVGFTPCQDWDVFTFPDYPGYIVIRNPFLAGFQRYWVRRCLQDFSADERNSSNLTNLGHYDCYDIWEDFVSRQCSTFSKDDRLRKLRWVTLGYHYGWQTKEYSEDRKAEFPRDVQCLSQFFSHCLGFGPFRAEAGIVNYYHLDSTLGGHTDHSEVDHTAPLLSFSFGQSCVFLLGGPTKEKKPMALFLRSGDVCVMSQEARLAYHAVPKILSRSDDAPSPSCFTTSCDSSYLNNIVNCDKQNGPSDSPENKNSENSTHVASSVTSDDNNVVSSVSQNGCHKTKRTFISEEYSSYIDTLNANIAKDMSNSDWKSFEVFLESSRINLNLRQVLPPGYESVEPQMMKFV